MAILILVSIQAVAGYFRPDLPKPSSSNKPTKDEEIQQLQEQDKQQQQQEKDPQDLAVDTTFDTSPTNASSVSDNNSNLEALPPKSMKRVAWEYGHRLMGMIVLGLSWYNCHSGIEWQVLNWDDQRDLTGVFWGITAAISGTIFILAYVVRV